MSKENVKIKDNVSQETTNVLMSDTDYFKIVREAIEKHVGTKDVTWTKEGVRKNDGGTKHHVEFTRTGFTPEHAIKCIRYGLHVEGRNKWKTSEIISPYIYDMHGRTRKTYAEKVDTLSENASMADIDEMMEALKKRKAELQTK